MEQEITSTKVTTLVSADSLLTICIIELFDDQVEVHHEIISGIL
ncbi:MAG TPA: hypothetical protein VFR61_01140 [Nitrososphaeraceae archaeon]|nr:hypothetical protein [Nitrososphaeraceae archaeon]